MASFNFYVHKESGEVKPLPRWRLLYESANKEEWHGKPAEECDPDLWLDDGKLEAIEVFLEDKPEPLGVLKEEESGSNGDICVVEWCSTAKDIDGCKYTIIWRFVTSGDGQTDDPEGLDWDDYNCVYHVCKIAPEEALEEAPEGK